MHAHTHTGRRTHSSPPGGPQVHLQDAPQPGGLLAQVSGEPPRSQGAWLSLSSCWAGSKGNAAICRTARSRAARQRAVLGRGRLPSALG